MVAAAGFAGLWGDGQRQSWLAAARFFSLMPTVNFGDDEAPEQGIEANNPNPMGQGSGD